MDAQRSDLWVVDFSTAITGLNGNFTERTLAPKLAAYTSRSVTLPELKTKSDQVRRDSRPYQMPSWDEPLDAIGMTFTLDSHKSTGDNADPYSSDLYQLLTMWRVSVRAGRGAMSKETEVPQLNAKYRVDYAFDVGVRLLRGCSNPTAVDTVNSNSAAYDPTVDSPVVNDLEFSMQLVLVKCWLGGFKMSELSYDDSKPVTISATFYAEDICMPPSYSYEH